MFETKWLLRQLERNYMIKNCKEKICCWPKCDKACGLVSTVNSTDNEQLIYELQAEIERLHSQIEYLSDIISSTREEEYD